MSKKTRPYQILQIGPLRPTGCIQPFTLKQKENNQFSFNKNLYIQNTVFLWVESWTWFDSNRK